MKKMIHFLLGLLILGGSNVMAQNWVVGGNSLSAHGRFGTNNNFAVIFETNNAERGRLTKSGLWGFGISSPSAKVHITGSSTQDPLKIQVNGILTLFAHRGGGFSIGNTTIPAPPANGLLVAGSAGIGGDPGSYKVKVRHGTFGFNIENATTLDDWEFWSNSGGLSLYANSAFRGNFNPKTGAYTAVSDEQFKTNIQSMPTVLERVNKLKPASYQMKQESAELANQTPTYGFIAQEVKEVFPHLVTHHVDRERGIDAYTLDYSGFGVIAIKAIQELQQNIYTLETRIVQLEAALHAADIKNNLKGKGTIAVWLESNFPNPFDQNTIIGYQAPIQAKNVSLVITNMYGLEVQRHDYMQTGNGQVEISAGSIPDGIYIYTLIIDGKPAASQKMVLSR